jgi:hypothetical protein
MYSETRAFFCGWDEDLVRLYRQSDKKVFICSLRREREEMNPLQDSRNNERGLERNL